METCFENIWGEDGTKYPKNKIGCYCVYLWGYIDSKNVLKKANVWVHVILEV